MPKRLSKRPGPKDVNEPAKSIVNQAIGEAQEQPDEEAEAEGKNPAAVALGRLGGKKGGPARAKKLSKKRRQETAKKAAKARWRRSSS